MGAEEGIVVGRCRTLISRTSPSALGVERLQATGTPGSRPWAAGMRSMSTEEVRPRWANGMASQTVTSVRAGIGMASLL